jgi:hypothetical protein
VTSKRYAQQEQYCIPAKMRATASGLLIVAAIGVAAAFASTVNAGSELSTQQVRYLRTDKKQINKE